METTDPRAVLHRLIRDQGADCASLSRLIGRNAAYLQQYIARGTPRRLAEADRRVLAGFFGVPEEWLGAPAPAPASAAPALRLVPRLDVSASAGPGSVADDRAVAAGLGFSEAWLRRLGASRDALSMIAVTGTSMLPTLAPGDEILVDTADAGDRLRDGVYVLRVAGALHVKRLKRGGESFDIVSDNPDADPLLVDDPAEVAVIGRVVWAGRRL